MSQSIAARFLPQKLIHFTAPWPPSINHYWRNVPRRGTLISKEGREYRRTVAGLVLERGCDSLGAAKFAVAITANPPDRRRRDLDNLLKALLDALQHAGLYDDDSNAESIGIARGPIIQGGRVTVVLREVMQ